MNPLDFVPIVLIFAVMYFLIIRPQIAERRKHEELLAALAKGDRVITDSGIHGVIGSVSGDTVVLEVGDKTRFTIDKSKVARRASADDSAAKS